jgi:Protein of unknown function (DUF3040)
MALSMDEQRMLAEIERRLAAEDPGLAARMSTFRRPGPVDVFRSARARVIGSVLTVAVVAMVSLMVYAILPFRSGSRAPSHQPVTTVSSTGQPRISAGSGNGSAKASGKKAGSGISAAAAPASHAAASHSPAAHASSSPAHAGNGSGATAPPISTFTGP